MFFLDKPHPLDCLFLCFPLDQGDYCPAPETPMVPELTNLPAFAILRRGNKPEWWNWYTQGTQNPPGFAP